MNAFDLVIWYHRSEIMWMGLISWNRCKILLIFFNRDVFEHMLQDILVTDVVKVMVKAPDLWKKSKGKCSLNFILLRLFGINPLHIFSLILSILADYIYLNVESGPWCYQIWYACIQWNKTLCCWHIFCIYDIWKYI